MNEGEKRIVSEVEKKRNSKSEGWSNKKLNYKTKLRMNTRFFLIRYEKMSGCLIS